MNNPLKKLYDQNCKRYRIVYSVERRRLPISRTFPAFDKIKTNVRTYVKYTIVELKVDGKHFHGLAAKADCDTWGGITGLAIAYNRAFKTMIGE